MSGTDKTAPAAPKERERPLSPHLQVYRLPLTAMLSISHRASGYAMAVGTIMIVWMLVAAASGPGAYGIFHDFAQSWGGKILLIGWSAALFYHMCNGIRHLIWDTGRLFNLQHARRSSVIVIIVALTLFALFWASLYTGFFTGGAQ